MMYSNKFLKLLFIAFVFSACQQSEKKEVSDSSNKNESLDYTFSFSGDSICGHPVLLAQNNRYISWYKPEVPGAAFSYVSKLASEFIKSGVPVDPKTKKKLYFISCCFEGPTIKGQEAFDNGTTWEDWMHNPACVFAGMVQSLAIDYGTYSGDSEYIDVVREMLDHQLEYGTTDAQWLWGAVPYASSDPGLITYSGARKWEYDGMRGDGHQVIEPDKVGELGIAYLKFYQIKEEKKYLDAALNCANALANNVTATTSVSSPWPYRVNAKTGEVISAYTSNVIESIRLFDELLRLKDRIQLQSQEVENFQKARTIAWDWLFSKSGPMVSYIWNGYFEDVPNDPKMENRVQNIPMETARYLMKNPQLSKEYLTHVSALTGYVESAFGTPDADGIKEQTWCFEPMASHTARFASINALLYEATGDSKYKEQAFHYFNYATYMAYEDGVVAVGPKWPDTWFSDGYGDYIRHFMEGLGAIPEWAPANENHLLRSSSVVQQISYQDTGITFRTYDEKGSQVLRLKGKPSSITMNGKTLDMKNTEGNVVGWTWEPLDQGGVLRLNHTGRDVVITL